MRAVWSKAGVLLGATLIACGCGSPTEDRDTSPTVIHLVEHATTDVTTDTGEMGDTVGDILTFANDLFDATNTTKVGTDQGYCVRVVVGASWECMWTAFLEKGQITVEGPFFDTKGSTLAITGGTREYDNAQGEMELKFRDDKGAEFDFIYTITSPFAE